MNEFVTDLEKSEHKVDPACHEAGDEMASVLKRSKELGKRVGKDIHAINSAMHENPNPAMLAGIGVGAVIGYLVACRSSRRCG